MTSIDTLTSNNFFQLNDKTAASAPDALDAKTIAAEINSSAPSLAEAFMLDLSPDAKAALQGASSAGSSGSSTAKSQDPNARFVLTQKQLQKIDDILQKYKDAPFTQETYDAIQHDLEQAGLSPQSLALQEKIKSFNPISILVNALGGGNTDYGSLDGSDSKDTEAANDVKSDNFMGDIVNYWKSISTTADATDDTATPANDEQDTIQASSEAS